MAKRKLLVLGSDFVTINIVNEAKKMGIYVIVADLMETSPTKENADEAWKISTTDIDLLEKKCREENITAIMFGASEFNGENARILCKRLNLPIYCESDKAWGISRNKGKFKELCKLVGVPVAKDYYITDEMLDDELDLIEYPVVVKPVDKSGNRGMSYCDNKEELVKAYKDARNISENERIIVERKLEGREYHINYVVAEGKAHLLSFSGMHHQPGQMSNLYSFEYSTPVYLKQYLDEVNDCLIKAFFEAGCKDGIVWVDAMRDDTDGKFYILEMGYRFPGSMLYIPNEKICGFSTVRWMVECALGKQHTINELPEPLTKATIPCAGSIHMFAKRNGCIKEIIGLESLEKLDNVYIDMPKRVGGQVRAYTCMGLIGIYGKDVEDMCRNLEKVNKTLHVIDETNNDLLIRFNDYETILTEYRKNIN